MNDEAPPCSQCKKPQDELTSIGVTAYHVWSVLDVHNRQFWSMDGTPLALPVEAVRGAVADYGLSLEMQELILALERSVIAARQKEHARKREKQ
ncbi:MAG: hypothetical protein LBV80_07855 [Deltaproteobacteria bacterium]|nr:hypothetical protein [Deltaproteobacteria bacterium]